MQRTVYSSENFNYKISIKQEFLIKNKNEDSSYKTKEESSFVCDEIILLKKNAFFELYLFFDLSVFTKEDVLNVASKINGKTLFSKYENFDCQNKFKIFPNKNDEDFWIEFIKVEKLNAIKLENKIMLDIICNIPNLYFVIKNNKANTDLDINLFLNRNTITDIEKKFIQYNYQNEQKGITLDKKKEKNADLFVDFMNKDDFNGSSFKITEEERLIFNPDALKIVDGFDDPSYELNQLIGLKNVKKELLKLNAKINYQYDRLSRNIYDANTTNLHMCFYGNPGTGKTTVARIVTSILYNMGYIKRNKCIEINANEFKGSKIGETAIKTKIILRNSINKVLFIDEAYALFDKRDGFGQEAVDTIIKEMEDNRQNMVIIFAGYKNEMQDFINMNEGLKSRISRYIEFENYDTIQLCKIFTNMLHLQNLTIDTNAFIKLIKIFKEMQLQDNFSNGRFVRNIFEELMEEHAFNVSTGNSPINIITTKDFSGDLMEKLYVQNKSFQR